MHEPNSQFQACLPSSRGEWEIGKVKACFAWGMHCKFQLVPGGGRLIMRPCTDALCPCNRCLVCLLGTIAGSPYADIVTQKLSFLQCNTCCVNSRRENFNMRSTYS